MQNSAIEIHDTTLTRVDQGGKRVTLAMQAYIHRSDNRPMIDPGTGWTQSVEIEFTSASCEGGTPDLPIDILDGELRIDGRAYPNEIPLPLNANGHVELELQLDGVTCLVVRGHRATVRLIGEAKFIENVPGSIRAQ